MVHAIIEQTVKEIKALTMPDMILSCRDWSDRMHYKQTEFDTSTISNNVIRSLLQHSELMALYLNTTSRTLEYSKNVLTHEGLEELLRTSMTDAIRDYGNKNWSKRYGSTILHKWLNIEMSDFDKALEVFQFVCGDSWQCALGFDIADLPSKYTHKEKIKLLKKIMKRKQK